ncbi:MAG: terminase small subunit [Cetobacterium sp.]|uniref:terminase small subunit n=1 Tax=Cetobacterium sp. ZWU0022 TaxID=1340502 RepID=UPI0006485CFD|nr:terminase small subunit [Cetobacterium sp. ZWU0022]
MKENKLTPKQKAFADYYIQSGNATDAAIKAGYNKKTAKQTGYENLTKPYIKSYIEKRMKEIESDRIATAEEVMKFLTSVMRGEVKDQFELDPSLQDRLKASDMLAKRFGLYTKDVDSELKEKSRKILQVKVIKNAR